MKESAECKDCKICRPNFIASYKSPDEWLYPFDYQCIFGIRYYPALAEQCPFYHTRLEAIIEQQ